MRPFTVLLACLLFAPALRAHGGAYVGPSAGGSADAGAGSVGAPTGASGAGGAGSGAAGSQPGLSGTPASRSSVRGSSGRSSASRGGAPDGQLSFLGWEFWWESNRDAFLDLKGHLAKAAQVPGSPGQLTSRSGKSGLAQPQRPSREWVETVLLPQLLAVAGSADDRDILDSTVVALARSAPQTSAAAAAEAIAALLAHREITVQAAAALGLGTLRAPDVTPTLAHLLRDDSTGRQAVGGGSVPTMVRAFAALALGLVGDAPAVRALLEAVTGLPDSEREVKCCAVAALGLLEPGDGLAATSVPVLLELLTDDKLDHVVRSYVPTTLGKLGDRGALAELLAVFRDDRTPNPVLQSVAIGLGRLATLDDRAVLDALDDYVARGRDQQTRHFALVSLGEIAGRRGAAAGGNPASLSGAQDVQASVAKRLRREIKGDGASREHRSWAALGAALLGRAEPDLQPRLLDALREAHGDERDPSFRGAFALALALLGDRASAQAIAADLLGSGQDDLRGHAAEALGLLHHEDAAPVLRALCLDAGVSETLRLKAATGLGLLGDRDAVPLLVDALRDAHSLSALASQARALGLIGDEAAGASLIELASDPSLAPLPRAFSLVALGLLGERERLPFNAALRADNNYYAQVPAIAEALRIL